MAYGQSVAFGVPFGLGKRLAESDLRQCAIALVEHGASVPVVAALAPTIKSSSAAVSGVSVADVCRTDRGGGREGEEDRSNCRQLVGCMNLFLR